MSKKNISEILKSDFQSYTISKTKKDKVLLEARKKAHTKVKQCAIIPLFIYQSSFAKAAVVVGIIISSLFAFEYSKMDGNNFNDYQPQIVDSSVNGMDTSFIFKRDLILR